MSEAITVPTKYIFLDVVNFTHERSVEAQSDIVSILNNVVHEALEEYGIEGLQLILLPTGDGMCICLLNFEKPYDVHILLALGIITRIHQHNSRTDDKMRRFQARIGINANTDNLVVDVNQRRNMA